MKRPEYTVGIDAGSVAIKVMVCARGGPRAWKREATGADIAAQSTRMLRELQQQVPGLASPRGRRICATGYGRNLIAGAEVTVSEILANALGAGWMWRHWNRLAAGELGLEELPRPGRVPGPFRTIIDIGGQDSKVITFTAGGMVDRFAMNERCAAGTGRFLEVMAGVLGVELDRLDELALAADEAVPISSTCTVFAESEVVSLLAEGEGRGGVAAGIFRGVARRVAELAGRVGWEPPVMFDGGPSRLGALRRALEGELGCDVAVPPCPEFIPALGAALHVAERTPGPSAEGPPPAQGPPQA